MILPEDDRFHRGSPDPYWNESSWFSIHIPERKANGFVYFYHRPNMKLSAGGAALWDPSGEDTYNCLFYEWDEHQALPADAEMFDFALRDGTGLTVELKEPLTSYHFAFRGDGCQLDLTWEAIIAPVEMMHGSVNPGLESWGTGHYEHWGRMTGVFELEGEVFDIACYSMHDRSWGPRNGGSPATLTRRGGFDFAAASESNFFTSMAVSPIPRNDDPIAGTAEPVVFGFYNRDGVLGRLVGGEHRVVERGYQGRPLRVVIEAEDDLGRSLHAVGEPQSFLKWHAYINVYSWQCLGRWEFDGQVGWGELDDYCTVRQNRRFQRSLQKQSAGQS